MYILTRDCDVILNAKFMCASNWLVEVSTAATSDVLLCVYVIIDHVCDVTISAVNPT